MSSCAPSPFTTTPTYSFIQSSHATKTTSDRSLDDELSECGCSAVFFQWMHALGQSKEDLIPKMEGVKKILRLPDNFQSIDVDSKDILTLVESRPEDMAQFCVEMQRYYDSKEFLLYAAADRVEWEGVGKVAIPSSEWFKLCEGQELMQAEVLAELFVGKSVNLKTQSIVDGLKSDPVDANGLRLKAEAFHVKANEFRLAAKRLREKPTQ